VRAADGAGQADRMAGRQRRLQPDRRHRLDQLHRRRRRAAQTAGNR
jgi:hypothetical protein